MKIQDEKKYDPLLIKLAVEYCESIGATEIINIACPDADTWRIMYKSKEGPVTAKLFPLPKGEV